MKRKIGIFGGSFNPIHVGHVALARQLLELGGLDEVWLMVSPQNPLKRNMTLLDDRLRFEMAAKALEGEAKIKACDFEMHLPKPSYTWNTLQALRQDYPDYEFTLLIGGDNWTLFDRWYKADEIAKNTPIMVYPRRGSDIDTSSLPRTVTVVNVELLDISSTEVRERAKQGKSIRGMVSENIEQLVIDNYGI